MTCLHLIDDQNRNHLLTADDSTLANLIDEIKQLAPQAEWNAESPFGETDRRADEWKGEGP